MKTIKIIIAIILTYACVKSGIDLSREEPNNTAINLSGILILLLIPAYLFYSATKNNDDDEKSKEKKENEEIKKIK